MRPCAIAVPVWLVDERMSSIDAAARFAQGRAAGARKRGEAKNLDAVAAAIILERWLGAPDDADLVAVGEILRPLHHPNPPHRRHHDSARAQLPIPSFVPTARCGTC